MSCEVLVLYIYPSSLKMQVSELMYQVRARRNTQEMASPFQVLQRRTGLIHELPQGMTRSTHLLRYEILN